MDTGVTISNHNSAGNMEIQILFNYSVSMVFFTPVKRTDQVEEYEHLRNNEI